jgi:hypothetical protein
MNRRKGIGLGVTLVIVALLAVVGFTLAALTVGRLQLLGNLQNKRRAHGLAMSAIEAALGKLNQQPQFGTNGEAQVILVPGDGNNGARLTFNPGEGRASINNLQGLTPQAGVPPASARLVAEARYGGSTEVLEALVTQPVFPFALACHGPIHSTQGLIVATLAEDTPSGRQNLLADPARYGKPANVLSNGTGAQSIQILGPSTICGDLQSSGRVDLSGTPIQILGELREDQDAGSIPEIGLNQLVPNSPQIIASAPSNSPTLSGAVVCSGPFVCTGDLNLQGASLYVRGDLTVGGELRGSGTLTVEGSTHLRGSANLNSLGRVALVSRGDVSLEGSGPQRSYFKGLVYTQGKLTAHGLMVYGCLLGAAPGPSAGPQLDLRDCVVIHDSSPMRDSTFQPLRASALLFTGPDSSAQTGLQATVRLSSSQRIGLRISQGQAGGDAALLDLEVNPDDPGDVQRFVERLRVTVPRAIGLTLTFEPQAAPSAEEPPVPGSVVYLGLTDSGNVQSQLIDLRNYFTSSSSSATFFDLNQFLRPNERLRIASCRRIR